MNLSNLKHKFGSRHRSKRLGCGFGCGHGKQCTRGMKGQRSRSGDGKMRGFEGGQMPLLRKLPKRGFTNKFRTEYAVVNLERLAELFPSGAVGPAEMRSKGLARKSLPIKVLGGGELTGKLQLSAHAFTKSAKAKVEQAGGTCAVLPLK